MFDFIRKDEIWEGLGQGLRRTLGRERLFDLKTIQDIVVFRRLVESKGIDIAEIGGGDSRVLRALASANRCVNVEKFEGADGGPGKEVRIRGVRNIHAFLGEVDSRLPPDSFDVVFSVSVVEHVPRPNLPDFLADGLRILRPGGLWLHAIDMYLDDASPRAADPRFDLFRSWARMPGALEPVGPIYRGPPRFSCDMATNPDNVLYEWGKIAPAFIDRRKRSQSVSLLVASRKSMSGAHEAETV